MGSHGPCFWDADQICEARQNWGPRHRRNFRIPVAGREFGSLGWGVVGVFYDSSNTVVGIERAGRLVIGRGGLASQSGSTSLATTPRWSDTPSKGASQASETCQWSEMKM